MEEVERVLNLKCSKCGDDMKQESKEFFKCQNKDCGHFFRLTDYIPIDTENVNYA